MKINKQKKEIKAFRDTASAKGIVVSADISEALDKHHDARHEADQ